MHSYNIIDSMVVVLLALFTIVLFRYPQGNANAHRVLAAFFVCLALSYMDGLFFTLNYYFHASYAHMVYLTMSFDYLIGPTLYFYVLMRTQRYVKWRGRYFLHGVPFVLHFSYLFYHYHQYSAATKVTLLQTKQVFDYSEVYAMTLFSSAHIAIYLIAVILQLRQYQAKIKQYYSSINRINLRWLTLITAGLLAGGLLRLTNNLLWLELPEAVFHQYVDLKLFALSSVLLFACASIYQSMMHPEILKLNFNIDDLNTIDDANASVDTSLSSPQHGKTETKYKNALLTDSARSELGINLTKLMILNRHYLDADLTLKNLADRLLVSPHHLSEVINLELHKNFYDFVNSYRLAESIRQLQDTTAPNKLILSIMLDSGFNSKSVFNTLFKARTGLTPSAFRRSRLQELAEERSETPAEATY